MEFPLLNYGIYLIADFFGYQHWYGRLLNLIVSSIVVWYFYRLVRDHVSEKVALPSTLALLASSWLIFSRKMMPDTFCMALMLIALFPGTLQRTFDSPFYLVCRDHDGFNMEA